MKDKKEDPVHLFGKDITTQITFVGLGGAGKTTFIKQLKGEEEIETTYSPTMGMNLEMLKLGELEVLGADMGGQKSYIESIWEPFVTKSDGVVFVFDAADYKSRKLAAKYLKKVINWTTDNAILLFVANKMDLKEAASLETIVEDLKLSDFIADRPHSFGVYPTSALKCTNVWESWDWLAEKVLKMRD
ncbi:MAG: ADP-ribosylation factor-like protein [Candidatus Hodarchaeales archaeon]|jgi:small GTP-binding protein